VNKVEVLATLIKDRQEFTRLTNEQVLPILERWDFVLRATPEKWQEGAGAIQEMMDKTIELLAVQVEREGRLDEVIRALDAWPTDEEIAQVIASGRFHAGLPPGPTQMSEDEQVRERAFVTVINGRLIKLLLARLPKDAETRWHRSEKHRQARISKEKDDGNVS
jgi:hypothetical protein